MAFGLPSIVHPITQIRTVFPTLFAGDLNPFARARGSDGSTRSLPATFERARCEMLYLYRGESRPADREAPQILPATARFAFLANLAGVSRIGPQINHFLLCGKPTFTELSAHVSPAFRSLAGRDRPTFGNLVRHEGLPLRNFRAAALGRRNFWV